MRQGSDRLVLCYHAVSSDWPAEVAVTPAQLAGQLRDLRERGYRGVTFGRLACGEVEGRAVAVTFDDGYGSVVEHARPVLDDLGMPATVFLSTDYVGHGPIAWSTLGRWVGTEHEHELEPMSWDDVRSLSEAGWEIGSHTKSHPHLTRIPEAQLSRELADSRMKCEEQVEKPCRSLAFPFGEHDDRVVAAAERTGYSAAATLLAGANGRSPLRWPRVFVSRLDGARIHRLRTSPIVRRSPALTLLARAPARIKARRTINGRAPAHVEGQALD